MLLEELKSSREQAAFLNLAYQVATADGGMGFVERNLISMYRDEMGIKATFPIAKQSLVDACHEFTIDCHKKVVLINLFYLVYCDGYINSPQKEMLESIRCELGIGADELVRFEKELSIIKAPYYPYFMEPKAISDQSNTSSWFTSIRSAVSSLF